MYIKVYLKVIGSLNDNMETYSLVSELSEIRALHETGIHFYKSVKIRHYRD